MAAIGLFTLNTSELNEGILGGLGTGFAQGSSTNTGTASGAAGLVGSASGSSESAGTANGAVGFAGSASGSSTSTGTATGAAQLTGQASGATSTAGAATGAPSVSGSASGVSVSLGDTSGTPALTGQASGASESTGSATGSPDVPPTPPTPPAPTPEDIVGGGPRFFIPRPPQPPRPQLQSIHREGTAHGYLRARGRATGITGQVGTARGSAICTGLCAGVRWPTDEIVARWARQAIEQELLTLELL